jgi:hypothetical protein
VAGTRVMLRVRDSFSKSDVSAIGPEAFAAGSGGPASGVRDQAINGEADAGRARAADGSTAPSEEGVASIAGT